MFHFYFSNPDLLGWTFFPLIFEYDFKEPNITEKLSFFLFDEKAQTYYFAIFEELCRYLYARVN